MLTAAGGEAESKALGDSTRVEDPPGAARYPAVRIYFDQISSFCCADHGPLIRENLLGVTFDFGSGARNRSYGLGEGLLLACATSFLVVEEKQSLRGPVRRRTFILS